MIVAKGRRSCFQKNQGKTRVRVLAAKHFIGERGGARSSTFETVDYDREKLLATFQTFRRCRHGAATTTKVEMRDKKDRVADAQQATAAAVEKIPPGGGVAPVRCLLPTFRELAQSLEEDQRTGAIQSPARPPFRSVATNLHNACRHHSPFCTKAPSRLRFSNTFEDVAGCFDRRPPADKGHLCPRRTEVPSAIIRTTDRRPVSPAAPKGLIWVDDTSIYVPD